MYSEETLSRYLDRAASGKPIPGGGSVAAVVGALGASMASMACNFTVGRDKFREVEEEVSAVLEAAEQAREMLLELAGRDSEAYSEVAAAYKLPRSSLAEKSVRKQAIQKAAVAAMDAPLETMRWCAGLLMRLPKLAEKGNPNLISDVGVSAILLAAALRSARLNVEINLRELKDEALVEGVRQEIKRLAEASAASMQETLGRVRQKVST